MNFQRLIQNKHTTSAGAVYVFAKLGCVIGTIWFPTHAAQFSQTADAIESAAVCYGLVMAGDSQPTKPTEEKK